MESNLNFKELWVQQKIPKIEVEDLYKKIEKYKLSGLKRTLFFNIVLLLTLGFVIFVWVYFQPQFIITKIGILSTITAILIFLFFSNKNINIYRNKPYNIQSNYNYLDSILKIKNKENFLQTKIMNIYFLLLSFGVALYMIEFTLKMPLFLGIIIYGFVILWFGFNWFILRPRLIKKNYKKINNLIQQLKKIKSQIEE